jgi:hypothetical protein
MMRGLLLLIGFMVGNVCFAQEQDAPEIKVRSKAGDLYAEILNRTDRVISGHDRGTNAHENIHMINSYYSNKTRGKRRAFYIAGEGKVFYSDKPALLKSDVVKFVPQSVRGNRYNLYIKGSPSWNDTPTYIMDEWVAYIGGAMVAVEDHYKGTNKDNSDRVCGPLEFSVYSIALCMAIEEKDNKFWNEKKEFRDFVYKMLLKSHQVYHRGKDVEAFRSSSQGRILNNLRTSEDCSRMRVFMKKWFNGVWLED